ncbi:UNVERIFIED_CONTAM: hypothetical protein K2H54_048854 [Gekko kuhli]
MDMAEWVQEELHSAHEKSVWETSSRKNGFYKVEEKTEPEETILVSSLDRQQTVKFPSDQVFAVEQVTNATSWTLQQAWEEIQDGFKEEELPQVMKLVLKLIHEMEGRSWADQPIWPQRAPSLSSFARLSIHRYLPEAQPTSKQHVRFSGHTPTLNSDMNNFSGKLVKTVFQEVSCAKSTGRHQEGFYMSSSAYTLTWSV